MTSRERAAYNAGVEAVRQAALIIAVTIEAQDGSRDPTAGCRSRACRHWPRAHGA